MTARDAAIKAMAAVFGDTPDGIYESIENTLSAAGYEPLFELLLDAVPPRVLAQLAIDTGALIDCTEILPPRWLDPDGTWFCFDSPYAKRVRFYRLAENGGPGGS